MLLKGFYVETTNIVKQITTMFLEIPPELIRAAKYIS